MLTRLILGLACLLAWCGAAGAQRVALVIGNGAYREVPALPNPPNDASDMHAALVRLGFESDLVVDADRATLVRAIRRFGERAVGADAALLFYAGHAVEVAGRNHLIPVTASIRSDRDLPFETIDIDTVMTQLEGRSRVILLFLDACRDNPFRQMLAQGTRGVAGQGLAAVRGPVGTLVAFATAPGTVAQDGSGRNSPFTSALLRHIDTEGLEVRPMLGRVRQSVREATAGAQIPWENASLEGEFFFRPARPAPAPPIAAAAPEPPAPAAGEPDRPVERVFWESIRDSRYPEEFEAYLRRYPDGVFADLARARIAALTARPSGEGVASAPTAPAPPTRPTVAPALPAPAAPPPPARATPTQRPAEAPSAPAAAPPSTPEPGRQPQQSPPTRQQQAGVVRPPAAPPASPPAPTPPADPGCVIRISSGMTSAGGSPGRIEMRNTGAPCGFRLWFNRVGEVPFRNIWISVQPKGGEVTVANPAVRYRPKPGFHGEDSFVVETIPNGRLYMTVRVVPAE